MPHVFLPLLLILLAPPRGQLAEAGMGGSPADSAAASRSCHFPSWDLSLQRSSAVTSPVTEPLPAYNTDSWWSG